jgi:hypothetical protein
MPIRGRPRLGNLKAVHQAAAGLLPGFLRVSAGISLGCPAATGEKPEADPAAALTG